MSRHHLAVVAAAWLAGNATAAIAADAPPPIGTPRAFALPARTEIALDNGLKLTMVPIGLLPKATVSIVVRTGSIDEGRKNGLADFAGEYLKEGAGGRSGAELAAAAADMGGELSVAMGTDESTFTLDVLSEKAPQAVALLASVLRHPALPAGELERLRANAARNVAVERSEPASIASSTFAHALWGTHPYGRGLPSDADIAAYRIADVRHYVGANFAAARTHVYVAGVYDPVAIEHATREAFGDWAAGPAPTVHVPHAATRHRVILIDRPGAPQSTIVIGQAGADPTQDDYIPLSVATTLLGGGLLSRLDQDLRETRGWTYGVDAHNLPAYRAASWTVSADVTTAHTAESVEAMLAAIRRLASEPPAADELRLTQNYRAGGFLIGTASRQGLLRQLAFLDLHGLPADWLSGYARRVYEVTPSQVSAVFAHRLPAASMTIVVLGDTAQFGAALRALPELAPATTQWTTSGASRPRAAPRNR